MFSRLLKGIFGSQGGYDSGFKQQMQGMVPMWDQAYEGAFGPDVFRRGMSSFTGNLDRNLMNQNAAGWGSLGSRGVSPTGNRMFGNQRAMGLANQASQLQQMLSQGRLGAMGQRAGLLQSMAPVFYNQPTPGILPGLLAGLGGGMFGGGGGGGQAPMYTPPFNPNTQFQMPQMPTTLNYGARYNPWG